jgi:hypothetical protein
MSIWVSDPVRCQEALYPDVVLFVQTSPAFCCSSLITEAMAKEIEKKTGTPVVFIMYDGTGGNKNDIIVSYLRYAASKHCGLI